LVSQFSFVILPVISYFYIQSAIHGIPF